MSPPPNFIVESTLFPLEVIKKFIIILSNLTKLFDRAYALSK